MTRCNRGVDDYDDFSIVTIYCISVSWVVAPTMWFGCMFIVRKVLVTGI